jgi:hypothetical protein
VDFIISNSAKIKESFGIKACIKPPFKKPLVDIHKLAVPVVTEFINVIEASVRDSS